VENGVKYILDFKGPIQGPIQGLLGVHSRYGLHTRAVTVLRWSRLSEQIFRVDKWSVCRVGLAPTGKRRLFTAHALSGLMHRSKSVII
jgi:hypothetical protein